MSDGAFFKWNFSSEIFSNSFFIFLHYHHRHQGNRRNISRICDTYKNLTLRATNMINQTFDTHSFSSFSRRTFQGELRAFGELIIRSTNWIHYAHMKKTTELLKSSLELLQFKSINDYVSSFVYLALAVHPCPHIYIYMVISCKLWIKLKLLALPFNRKLKWAELDWLGMNERK